MDSTPMGSRQSTFHFIYQHMTPPGSVFRYHLIKLGIRLESITTDGHKTILKAIKNHCRM